jgi:hypothetical protein
MTAIALALIEAVHAAGGTIALDGSTIRLEAPAPLSELLRASLRQHKPALVLFLAEQAANANAPAPATTNAPLPVATAAEPMPVAKPGPWSAGIPDPVAEGIGAMFMATAARDIPDRVWPAVVADTLAFVDSGQAAQAFALGWTAAELFGCDRRAPWQRLDRMGLMLLVDRRVITAVTADHIALRHRDGSVQRFRRTPIPLKPPVAMLWQLLLPKRLRPLVGPAP